jgi:hypothetical protein
MPHENNRFDIKILGITLHSEKSQESNYKMYF